MHVLNAYFFPRPLTRYTIRIEKTASKAGLILLEDIVPHSKYRPSTVGIGVVEAEQMQVRNVDEG